MKEKVFKREKESVKTELATGETKTETKTETEEIISQETLCENIYNLSSAVESLSNMDTTLFGNDTLEKVYDTKLNMINAIYIYSTHLITEQQP